jgi:hypothetical protein
VQSQHIVKNRILGQLSADELKSVQPWLTPVELRSNTVLHEPKPRHVGAKNKTLTFGEYWKPSWPESWPRPLL